MKLKILNLIVGKNLSRIPRVVLTALGTYLLTLPIFDPAGAPLADPGLAAPASEIGSVTAEQVQDGLTLREIVQIIGGMLMIWLSRAVSFFRAKFPTLAPAVGVFVGRSIPSLIRAVLTATGVFLARFLGSDMAPEAIADMPLVELGGLILPILIGNVCSALQDGKANPKPLIS